MNHKILAAATLLGAGLLSVPLFAWQQGAADGPTASAIVTLEPRREQQPEAVTAQEMKITLNGKPETATSVTPIGNSPMQLGLLIDDSAGTSFDTEVSTIKQWINSLPPYIQIGVGYMRNGMTVWTHQFTSDHAAAANSVRVAAAYGGADVSPYDSVSDAIKHWSAAPDIQRREVILVSSGIEALGGGMAPENPYVNAAIANAQRAGVVAYGIYNPSVGHYGHVLWAITYGQNLLSQYTDETGGEAYVTTISAPVDFGPFLRSAVDCMQRQYRVEFTTHDVKKGLQSLRIRPAEAGLQFTYPKAVPVP